MSIFEQITIWATGLIAVLGYPGVLLLMALESMIVPIPSEAVMPFAGFLVAEGQMNILSVVIWATIGSIIGSLISYYIGLWGGRVLVLKVGKYLLLNEHHLDVTESFFEKRGDITVFISRFIPVIRHFISIPAGMGKMPLLPFVIYTTIGAGLWNWILAYAGFNLRANWASITPYFHIVDKVILGVIVLAILCFIWSQLKPHQSKFPSCQRRG
ncbi:TPA: DedA family protein [Patescibacteria group bacterium]|nr:DedA family protein [Patescibacteria group bacterium]HCR41780.1 DedA family protein [Patescibacteria group bacterium]